MKAGEVQSGAKSAKHLQMAGALAMNIRLGHFGVYASAVLYCDVALAQPAPADFGKTVQTSQQATTEPKETPPSEAVRVFLKRCSPVTEDPQVMREAFDKVLAKLADAPLVAGKTDGALDSEIRTMSMERLRHPERAQVIHDEYLMKTRTPGSRVALPPLVRPEHLTVEFRGAWEYWLLAPKTGVLHHDLPRQALAAIGDSKALCLVVFEYRMRCDLNEVVSKGQDLPPVAWRRIGQCISAFASTAGVNAMLDCYDATAAACSRAEVDPANLRLAKGIRGALFPTSTDVESVMRRAKWLEVLNTFPRAGLSEARSSFIDALLKEAASTNPQRLSEKSGGK